MNLEEKICFLCNTMHIPYSVFRRSVNRIADRYNTTEEFIVDNLFEWCSLTPEEQHDVLVNAIAYGYLEYDVGTKKIRIKKVK